MMQHGACKKSDKPNIVGCAGSKGGQPLGFVVAVAEDGTIKVPPSGVPVLATCENAGTSAVCWVEDDLAGNVRVKAAIDPSNLTAEAIGKTRQQIDSFAAKHRVSGH